MSKKHVDPMHLTKGKDLVKYAVDNGGYVDRVKGDHYIIKGSNPGSCPIPYRDNNVSIGLRKTIVDKLIAIGVIASIIFGIVCLVQ